MWVFSCYKCYFKPFSSSNVKDQPDTNTKRNHATDPLKVPIGPITRARAKKLKEALNKIVQNI
jgi:hypothetical protein